MATQLWCYYLWFKSDAYDIIDGLILMIKELVCVLFYGVEGPVVTILRFEYTEVVSNSQIPSKLILS